MIDQADVVVIGAGSFGSSPAYHLAKLGMRNVVLLDRFEPGSQTSPRAAGLTSQVRATDTLTRLAQRSVEKLERFQDESGQPLRFTQSGALKIARTERTPSSSSARSRGRGRSACRSTSSPSPRPASCCPVLDERGIVAMTWSPTDCNVEPSQVPVGYAGPPRSWA